MHNAHDKAYDRMYVRGVRVRAAAETPLRGNRWDSPSELEVNKR